MILKNSEVVSIRQLIVKRILNSLYGRLGMMEIESRIDFVDEVKLLEIFKTREDFTNIGNNKSLVKYKKKK